MPTIKIENVSAESKSGSKIEDVSMFMDKGEYICVLGPTGSGPTLILQALAGLIKINSGKIIFDEKDITQFPPEDRHIGMVFEQFNLFPHLSVMDNLLFGPRMRRENIEDKKSVVEEVLNMVRLTGREDAISRELSGGMQQRVGVARAIVAGAKILLLDQPYRALDAKIRAEMRLEIKNIVKGLGLNCVHSTHETEEAMLVADRIAIFNNGKLEQFSTPEEIFDDPVSEFVASFVAESNIWNVKVTNGVATLDNGLTINYNATKYNDHNYSRLVLRQHSIDLYTNKEEVPNEWNNFEGKVTKVRLLGEFIRIVVEIDGVEVYIRDLLNPSLRDPLSLIGRSVILGFPINEVKLF